MKRETRRSFLVYGAGRVGTAMAAALARAGWECLALCGRDRTRVARAARLVGAPGTTRVDPALARRAQVVLVGVPDDAIAGARERLVALGAVGPAAALVHFSGRVGSGALADPARPGGAVASMHPNLAIADPARGAAMMRGAWFGVEGNRRGAAAARRMVRDVGGIPVAVAAGRKDAYHLAAVFASNGMVALASIARDVMESAGVRGRDAERVVASLMAVTARNLGELGVLRALTGPAVRGDAGTVAAHLEVLRGEEGDAGALYGILSRRLVALGREARRAPEEKYRAIDRLLSGRKKPSPPGQT